MLPIYIGFWMVRRRASDTDPDLAPHEDVLRDWLTVVTGSGYECRSPQGVGLQGAAAGRGSGASSLLPPRCRSAPRPGGGSRLAQAAADLEEELRGNFPSANGHEAQIEAQIAKEIALGAMVECDLEEAQRSYGKEPSLASLGAIPESDQSVRVVHDATHGKHVSDSVRVRDARACPTGADLKQSLQDLPDVCFFLSGEVSGAHRLIQVRCCGWHRQACQVRDRP